MPSSGAGGSTQIPCIEIKRLDRGVVGRTHEYPGLVKGTKVLVAGEGAVADSARSLLKAAGCQVTALCTAAATTTPDCTVVEGSATSSDACAKAVVGQQVVVHVGGPSCSAALGLECVTSGTRNLLEAAAAAGVKAFVFETSTSVVSGEQTSEAVSEDAPYPKHYADPAAAALAEAERTVLTANAAAGVDGMLTCSVRAAPVYGPGESHGLIPGLAYRAKVGIRAIGDGRNVMDFVYSGNVAHALILAAQSLLLTAQPAVAGAAAPGAAAPGAAARVVPGRAFFVTDVEPVPYGEFAGRALSRLGYPAADSAGGAGEIPVALALAMAFLLRVLALVVSPILDFRPALTAQRVAEESEVRRFDTSRAREELGYAPRWTQEEALDIILHSAISLRNPRAKVKYVGPFTAAEVAQHSTEEDAWIIVNDKVYDVTPYLGQHPGGDALLRNVGGDSTKGMHGPQHPAQAMEILEQHFIGHLEA